MAAAAKAAAFCLSDVTVLLTSLLPITKPRL
jgi:hypothetical protein